MPIQKYGMPGFSTARHTVRRVAMRGAATVEFAFLLIPLLLLGFGGAEYGRALYQYNTLVKSVRDSARYLSQYSPTDPNYSTLQNTARNLAVYGDTTNTGNPLVPGLTTSMVTFSNSAATATPPMTLLQVTITGYQFSFVFDPVILLGGTTPLITFGGATGIHATMRQS